MTDTRISTIPAAAPIDPRLSALDVRILAIIGREQSNQGFVQIKRADIAQWAQCCVTSVPRSIRKLEQHGYLERRIAHNGKVQAANEYRVKLDQPHPFVDTRRTEDTRVPNATRSTTDTRSTGATRSIRDTGSMQDTRSIRDTGSMEDTRSIRDTGSMQDTRSIRDTVVSQGFSGNVVGIRGSMEDTPQLPMELVLSNSEISPSKERSPKGDPKKGSPNPGQPASGEGTRAVEIYNDAARRWGWVAARGPHSAARQAAVKARLREHGLAGWTEAIVLASQSAFLAGENDRGWRISLDWLTQPKNFTKVIEGSYAKTRDGDAKPKEDDGFAFFRAACRFKISHGEWPSHYPRTDNPFSPDDVPDTVRAEFGQLFEARGAAA